MNDRRFKKIFFLYTFRRKNASLRRLPAFGRPRLAGDRERAVRAVVELGRETGPAGLAGRVDLEAGGPAAVAGRVLDPDLELDRRRVPLAQLFPGPLLELVPAVEQAALRVDLPVHAPVLRHQVPRLDRAAERGRDHVALLVVRLPVQLGHPSAPLVAREVGARPRQRVQLALDGRRHRRGLAVLARHPRLRHLDRVLAEQRVLGSGRARRHHRRHRDHHRRQKRAAPLHGVGIFTRRFRTGIDRTGTLIQTTTASRRFVDARLLFVARRTVSRSVDNASCLQTPARSNYAQENPVFTQTYKTKR